MSNIVLARNYKAESAIAAFTLTKHGTVDGNALPAAAATDGLLGVSTDIAAAIGERVDVIVAGVADVLYGGVVTRGDLLTADASGRAVKAVPAAGINNRVVGIANVSGVLGDVGSMILAASSVQG
jgi:hypothetical protein